MDMGKNGREGKDEDLIRLFKETSRELRKISRAYGEDFAARSIQEDRDSR